MSGHGSTVEQFPYRLTSVDRSQQVSLYGKHKNRHWKLDIVAHWRRHGPAIMQSITSVYW